MFSVSFKCRLGVIRRRIKGTVCVCACVCTVDILFILCSCCRYFLLLSVAECSQDLNEVCHLDRIKIFLLSACF